MQCGGSGWRWRRRRQHKAVSGAPCQIALDSPLLAAGRVRAPAAGVERADGGCELSLDVGRLLVSGPAVLPRPPSSRCRQPSLAPWLGAAAEASTKDQAGQLRAVQLCSPMQVRTANVRCAKAKAGCASQAARCRGSAAQQRRRLAHHTISPPGLVQHVTCQMVQWEWEHVSLRHQQMDK